MLPFLAGERSPDYLPDARAVIAGLRLSTTRDDIFRAGLESVGYQFLDVLEELVTVSAVTRLVATGTALTSSRVWPQILADTLGRPIARAARDRADQPRRRHRRLRAARHSRCRRRSRRSRACSIPTRAATRCIARPPRASESSCALC